MREQSYGGTDEWPDNQVPLTTVAQITTYNTIVI